MPDPLPDFQKMSDEQQGRRANAYSDSLARVREARVALDEAIRAKELAGAALELSTGSRLKAIMQRFRRESEA